MSKKNYYKIGECDLKELSRLAKLCIGSRTLVEYSRLTGLSTSFLSRIVNASENLARPTKRSLLRFTGEDDGYAENGVTSGQLLAAAGYETDEVDEQKSKPEPASEGDGLTAADAIVSFYSPKSPFSPVTMLINALLKRGMTARFDLNFRPSAFSIGKAGRELTALPAFCPEEQKAKDSVKVAVMTSLITSIQRSSDAYLVMTDNLKLYDEFKDVLPPIEGKTLSILYTADYEGFSKQTFIGQKNWICDGKSKGLTVDLVD